MPSVRLNAKNRKLFLETVKKDVLGDRPKVVDWSKKWSARALDQLFGLDLLTFDAYPRWMMKGTKEYKAHMWDTKEVVTFDLVSSRQLPYQDNWAVYYHNMRGPTISKDSDMGRSYAAFMQVRKDWDDKTNALDAQIKSLITGLNTDLQVYAAWPGAKKYAACFPHKAKNYATTSVTAMEMDVGISMSKLNVKNEVEQN